MRARVRHHKSSKKVPEERSRDRIETVKAENRKLRKEVAQLRKELSKVFTRDADLRELIEEIEIEVEPEEVDTLDFKCPHCKSRKVTVLEKLQGNHDYYSCTVCNAKGRIR